jgi:hypothetical protein
MWANRIKNNDDFRTIIMYFVKNVYRSKSIEHIIIKYHLIILYTKSSLRQLHAGNTLLINHPLNHVLLFSMDKSCKRVHVNVYFLITRVDES